MDPYYQWLHEKRLAEAQELRELGPPDSVPRGRDVQRVPAEPPRRRMESLGFFTSVAVVPMITTAAQSGAYLCPSALGAFSCCLGIL